MSAEVVIGVDAGGTSTRCAVATREGRILARGSAGGANQYSSPDPAAALVAALRDALAGAGRVTVTGAVFGIAGASGPGRARAMESVLRAWGELGLPGTPHVSDDIAVAFAAGSTVSAGTVLIAGTGAVAARVREGTVTRRCDGHGWLLGDEGSAVWIGLAGLRAVLAAEDGRQGATVLAQRLPAALGIAPGDPQALVRAVHDRPPARLGELAPEVTRAAEEGDPQALRITVEAAGRLLAALEAVAPRPAEPLVLAGSVLGEGPVAREVRAAVERRFGVTPIHAGEGVLGALGLALRRCGAGEEAHAALLEA
ncbi:N-acetylglucosamine kinase [Marinactinospora thermotolerans]|uniref:BadF-type ATPase n=1 Tax=Marinactinospora thermotolerans DSM 45154 TaxID=1122192 RepID=A0A1T4RSU0_9ACTN|nr:BadF/BadG/BcrA/BcrD ATPase family protein [Marinactinospora thermotolerans]SKA19050.1 BadF-type ATPase [Marinactinospora thermotolerans DSM 45154]